MAIKEVIISQYLAALEMLKQAVIKCPEPIYNDPDDKTRFWHIAYHTLFYTHLYLQESEEFFTPWVKHKQNYQFLGPMPWPPHALPDIGEPYNKEDILEYLATCYYFSPNFSSLKCVKSGEKCENSVLPLFTSRVRFPRQNSPNLPACTTAKVVWHSRYQEYN